MRRNDDGVEYRLSLYNLAFYFLLINNAGDIKKSWRKLVTSYHCHKIVQPRFLTEDLVMIFKTRKKLIRCYCFQFIAVAVINFLLLPSSLLYFQPKTHNLITLIHRLVHFYTIVFMSNLFLSSLTSSLFRLQQASCLKAHLTSSEN